MSLSQTMAALGQSIAAATAAVDKYQSDVDVAIADRDNRILILAQQNDLLRTENADLQAQLAKPTTPPTPPVTPPAGELAVLNRVPSRAEVAMIDRAALRTILGDYRLKAGETLENALVKGCVTASYIKGQTPGRIRNCVIDALDEKAYCVNFTGNQMDVLVENCELVNSRAGATYGEHYKLRRPRRRIPDRRHQAANRPAKPPQGPDRPMPDRPESRDPQRAHLQGDPGRDLRPAGRHGLL
jgi:hypothetical protein